MTHRDVGKERPENFYLGPHGHGRYTRITVEQKVADIAPLVRLQEQLAAELPGFRPARHDDLHVTLLHLGKMDELLAELLGAVPDLSMEALLQALQPVLNAGVGSVPEAVRVRATGLAKLGAKFAPAVVLTLEREPSWLQRREPMMDALKAALRRLGITEPEQFLARSRNLRGSEREVFKPHATMGRLQRRAELPELEVAGMELVLAPSSIRGAKALG